MLEPDYSHLPPEEQGASLSTLKDVISAMKEVLLLTDKVERAGGVLT
jgi:hypothetical protein